MWRISLTGNLGSDDQSWVATCLDSGVTESGDDAPSQIGVMSWSEESPRGDPQKPPLTS